MENSNLRIAAYTRISVDDDLNNDNVSIENQKNIISDFCKKKFPYNNIDFYEDRDKSGYTFEQRSGYQKMRKLMVSNYYQILIVKDFSRFSRRNSKGLAELEDMSDIGIRIISIDDNIDYPKNNDLLSIQFRFLMNELPVTDTSKKIKSVIKNRQERGEWICNAPYGYYLHPTKKNVICVDPVGEPVVKLIFDLYNKGWGYKKISHYLTENKYPTALMLLKKQLEEKGTDTSKIDTKINKIWNIATISKIIKNDFYIGTLRQHVWVRKGINKSDVRVKEEDHIVFENNHTAIIDKDVFYRAQENLKNRTRTHYKGERKYPIPYSGHIFCKDCGSPMFSISNPTRKKAYTCGSYHRRGLKGCTSHHIYESILDEELKAYIKMSKNKLCEILTSLDEEKNNTQIENVKTIILNLEKKLNNIKLQLKESIKQKIKQISLTPQDESIITETYVEIEKDYKNEIKNINLNIEYLKNERNRKKEIKNNIDNVLKMFDNMLNKENFTKEDISLLVQRITVNQFKEIEIKLKPKFEDLITFENSLAI